MMAYLRVALLLTINVNSSKFCYKHGLGCALGPVSLRNINFLSLSLANLSRIESLAVATSARISGKLFMFVLRLLGSIGVGIFMSAFIFINTAHAQAVGKGISNLELPRFVSLKAGEARLRVGPGKNYGVDWLYVKRGLPLEVVQEFDYWRRVRDSEGNEGWIFHSLLSGKRTIVIAPWEKGNADKTIIVRARPDRNSKPVRRFQPGVLAEVTQCDGSWCYIVHKNGKGYVAQGEVWGVYPDEKLDN